MEMRERKDRENRNDCKRAVKWGFAGIVLYDQQRIEKKLTEMARKGWLIEEMHDGLFWTYRRIEPKELHFAAVYSPQNFGIDADSLAAQSAKNELCARDGWIPAADWETLRVYYNEQPDPVPIETDPVVQTESIYAAMKLRWWYYPFLSLSTMIAMFSAYLRNPRWSDGIVPTLTDPLFLLWLCFAMLSVWWPLYQFWADIRWHRAAKKAAESGEFLPIMAKRIPDIYVMLPALVLIVIMLFITLA